MDTTTLFAAKKSQRLLSIDALRRFDMLLIAGGGTFIGKLEGKTKLAWVDGFAQQFHHMPLNGFSFYDFIFPLFLFIAGVYLPFSMNKGSSAGLTKRDLYRKFFRRLNVSLVISIVL
jgi:predicted acyltransferase